MKHLMHLSLSSPARRRGFTLIELMIAVAVVGILAAIAFPSYTQHIRKSRRAEAKSALLDLASRQERYFSVNNVYTNVPANLGYSGTSFPIDIVSGGQAYYKLEAKVPSGAPTTYTGTATPVSPGPQAADTCGTYSIDQLGTQSPTTSGCW